MSIRLDTIIFGATGYTGKRVVQLFVEITARENNSLTWAVAGRSAEKLEAVLRETEQITGKNLQKVPIIIADTKNEHSLMKMASQGRLVINCAGPYKYHGEPVVRACIQQHCHYVDVTAEPQFQERIQLLYDEEAARKGVFVVLACGIDSMVADMGVDFLQKKFDGTINSIESYWEIVPEDGNYGSGVINNGTWQSLLLVLRDYAELKEIRTKLFKKMPKLEPKLALRRLPHKVPTSGNISIPFPGPDATVIRRSQRYFYEKHHQSRPAQIHTYIATSNFVYPFLLYFAFLIVNFLVRFRFVFDLFSKWPKLFSAGFFGDHPNKAKTENFLLTTTHIGRGWKGKIVDEFYKEKEDAWISVKVTGRDGYRITAVCAVVSALILLDENEKNPEVGGVYTPASCFTNTKIVDLLQQNGIQFEVSGQGANF